MILKLSLIARTVVVYPNYGCATLIMTAVMIPTNLHTCADKGIVLLAGKDAPVNRIIVAYPNGYSVMVRTTVVTIVTNKLITAHPAIWKPTSNAPIIDAYQSN